MVGAARDPIVTGRCIWDALDDSPLGLRVNRRKGYPGFCFSATIFISRKLSRL
jgi:hypothetical protein